MDHDIAKDFAKYLCEEDGIPFTEEAWDSFTKSHNLDHITSYSLPELWALFMEGN